MFIVVDISNATEELVQQLQYWNSFVANQDLLRPHMIVIGSHFDIAKSNGQYNLSQALNELPHLTTSITLDCTRKSSSGLRNICSLI